ncbi:ABC transporter permease [Bacillus sp. RAR_GA_16]|uniref:ABC transporter permease n=1 Tax=Bacillus sp. RAR_GA_16 TaxID=2876774 RepID=UPI001CC9728A|nr:ABC transporter permease [Bacillus sp. RAR_GA_16]MCA0172597.1 ABC transporter permease [Bacillus sp. RAR_GA_16]
MKNSLKVAKWEFKQNMTNKSFLISIFMTPTILILFSFLPSIISGGWGQTDFGTLVNARLLPSIVAGSIFLSVLLTGMLIFQSASKEKKEKVAEIILSSMDPHELMQGKIIGYFALGVTQVFIWFCLALPIVVWKLGSDILEYLFVPKTFVLVFIALLGYFLFAALLVGLGATVEDVASSSNFQGVVMMLPFSFSLFIVPVLEDPNGIVATIGSYLPFTASGTLIFRLSLLEVWPWKEIVLSIGLLLFTSWICMKMAGKIFKVGILLYGKNASLREIWKWMWA